MTELRKVEDLGRQLESLIGSVNETDVSVDPTRDICATVISLVCETLRRSRKLWVKAIEADPNKQLYNESTCKRIVDLHSRLLTVTVKGLVLQPAQDASASDVEQQLTSALNDAVGEGDEVVVPLLRNQSDLLHRLADKREAAIVKLATDEAWQKATADGINGTQERETVHRICIQHECAEQQLTLVSDMAADRKRVRLIEEKRESDQWESEAARRRAEASEFESLRCSPSSSQIAVLCSTDDGSHWDAMRRRAASLLREVLANPERREIRIINATRVSLEHFGMMSLTAVAADGTVCACGRMRAWLEALLGFVGYRPRYATCHSGGVNFTALVLHDLEALRGGVLGHHGSSALPAVLPCGLPTTQHTFSPIGYERYGDRSLSLEEPNPSEELDAWCEWHQRVQSVVNELQIHNK